MHTPTFDGVQYALGITAAPLRLERGNPMLFNHDGGGFGFGSCFTYCPEHKLAWIVLHNGQTKAGPPAPFDRIGLQQALRAKFGRRTPRPRPTVPTVTTSREALASYVGSYVAGQAIMTVGWEGEAFGFRLPGDEALNPLVFTGPDDAFIAGGPRASRGVRMHPRDGSQPPWVQFEHGDVDAPFAFRYGSSFDLNESEGALPGQIGAAYDRVLGDYQVIQWGVPIMTVSLTEANGHLYIGPIRLEEHQPGLLFSADGEALDLTREPPTYRNIPLHRVAVSVLEHV